MVDPHKAQQTTGPEKAWGVRVQVRESAAWLWPPHSYFRWHRADAFTVGDHGELIITACGRVIVTYAAGMWSNASLHRDQTPAIAV